MPPTELLLREHAILRQLYDTDSMSSIQTSIAHGYIALLGGLDGNNTDTSLAFSALTQGNVIDACFGVVELNIRRGQETPASRAAKAAKSLLAECSSLSADEDQFQNLAVSTYCLAFQEIVSYHGKRGRLNCLIRCCRFQTIRRKIEKQLRVTFLELAKVIAELR